MSEGATNPICTEVESIVDVPVDLHGRGAKAASHGNRTRS
jgi:hypothetical protein